MTIDPPAINNLLRQLSERRQQSVDALVTRATLSTTRLLDALVLQVAPASAQQRQSLNTAMQANASASGQRPDATLSAMLQSPTLMLAELELEQQRRLIFTDKPLQSNSKVQVEITSDGRLRLVEAEKPAQSNQRGTAFEANISTLSRALRETLPHQAGAKDLHQLLTAMEKLELGKQLRDAKTPLPTTLQHSQALFAQAKLNQATTTLVDKLLRLFNQLPKSPAQLQQGQNMRHAIRDSGIFLEAKLLQALVKSRPALMAAARRVDSSASKPGAMPSSPSPTALKALNDLARQLNRAPNAGNATPRLPADSAAAIRSDGKAALLHAKSEVEALLERSTAFMTDPLVLPRIKTSLEQRDFASALKLLLQGSQTPEQNSANQSSADGKNQGLNLRPLLQMLQQHIVSTLARIQVQQTRNLLQSNSANDGTAPAPTNIQLEIPVRTEAGIQHVQVQFEEEWLETKENKTEETKQRQWNVMLAFDLVDAGPFYARIRMLSEQITIQFWAERETTLQEAKAKFARLREDLNKRGVQVADIQCAVGSPPQRSTSLSYALVDVTT